MIYSSKFTAVLDTNVIFPLTCRDLLFWFAYRDLYTVKWSKHIFSEWEDVMEREGISKEKSAKQIKSATSAFPFALVENYERIIPELQLPDQDDCHVLAAAIKVNASVIVTNNIKDFPDAVLEVYGIEARTADDFLADIIDLNPEIALEAFMSMVMIKENPPLDEYQVLDHMRKIGLKEAADAIHQRLA